MGCCGVVLSQIFGHFAEQAERQAEAAASAAKERARAAARGGRAGAGDAPSAKPFLLTVLLLTVQRDKLPSLHAACPTLAAVEGTQLDFQDYSSEEMAMLLRLATEERGFQLHPDLTVRRRRLGMCGM